MGHRPRHGRGQGWKRQDLHHHPVLSAGRQDWQVHILGLQQGQAASGVVPCGTWGVAIYPKLWPSCGDESTLGAIGWMKTYELKSHGIWQYNGDITGISWDVTGRGWI